MNEEYVGSVVLEWGSLEIECISVSSEISTGAREIYTMNKSRVGKATGVGRGVRRIQLSAEVPIPARGLEPDWLGISGAKITVAPVGDGPREVYEGCHAENMTSKYTVDGVSVRTVRFIATDLRTPTAAAENG